MFRPTALRLAVRRTPFLITSSGGGSGNNQMYIVLGAIIALGAGGYWYLKPMRDVASMAHGTMKSAQEQAGKLSDTAGGMAKAYLPPGAFALYSSLASQPGGINGFLTSLKDKDLKGVIEEVKKVGGDDLKRIVEKVEKRVKDAEGKVEKIDWQSLAKELKEEIPKDKQQYVDMLIGRLPSKESIEQYVTKAKELGEQKLKEVETSASKILAQVEKARKEGRGQADAFIAGLKQAAPADVDDLISKLKDVAKSAGLPADTAEVWLKAKAEDGKLNAEQLGKQFEDQLRDAANAIPGEPKEVISQVEKLSPSIAKLLSQALQQVGIVDEQGNRKK
ncbi:hypothetical protein TREMEDRAFT_67496 [Tremella mesenterica DSM 1558]|uniref:uncharacterized protein n=1 Tax=Tremella mesenterica (strain ATCC 24925 / CBS 8224 / DSM 1558 / NBRC 9311 / NRRL Y-6157 / RJB 2259-6 / UBC 559-6) TaxID=578456 RepID=UPI0003F49ACD|nr:uncharacterized protein TREMEDRAFT_67496 [Tremella mesenterica DSM 1558]EIW73680.1 hypothetical protein TREMEDRAFT_67496 [Tremella mesenterica DSM 1558]